MPTTNPRTLHPQAKPSPLCAAKPHRCSKRLEADNKNFLRYALGSLAECDTQLVIAETLSYGEYTKKLKSTIMALMMGIRAYGKSLSHP